jgi:hypothetical protein
MGQESTVCTDREGYGWVQARGEGANSRFPLQASIVERSWLYRRKDELYDVESTSE